MKYSFICCSADPVKAANWRANWRTVMAGHGPYELIVITDAENICEGYQRGALRASGDKLIFCHDDMLSIEPDFAEKLAAHFQHADVIGGAGTDKLIDAKWFSSGPPHMFGQVLNLVPAQKGRDQTGKEIDVPQHLALAIFGVPAPLVNNCVALDGFFIAASKGVLEWDAKTYTHFHLYDLDATYSAYTRGWKVAVATDLGLFHYSSGGYHQPQWKPEADKFLAKWKDHLPPQPPQITSFATSGAVFGDVFSASICMKRLVARTRG